ncbi:hypothetical protein BDY21DRAFT_166381 [Lineolata rhizophorae]|uniref:Uncharacterized protein n=1 Tax=Lineolata rhizophorae TaxID=578093 RepID=A0A6A6P967_9PEZI|nr:hypothetical protein BDY21DRAFT_166381 [Lineolata rhizophorae]
MHEALPTIGPRSSLLLHARSHSRQAWLIHEPSTHSLSRFMGPSETAVKAGRPTTPLCVSRSCRSAAHHSATRTLTAPRESQGSIDHATPPGSITARTAMHPARSLDELRAHSVWFSSGRRQGARAGGALAKNEADTKAKREACPVLHGQWAPS